VGPLRSAGEDDPYVAVQSGLERRVQSALRNTPHIGSRNRDRDYFIAAIQDLSVDVPAYAEALKHASGVIVGAPTDVSDDPQLWLGAERASAGIEGSPGIKTAIVLDDDLYFAPPVRKTLGG